MSIDGMGSPSNRPEAYPVSARLASDVSGILGLMLIRHPLIADWPMIEVIDGTIESARYLHVDRAGNGLTIGWRLEERPLRSPLMQRNALSDDLSFTARSVINGVNEGLALCAEHDGQIVAFILAVPESAGGILKVLDLRVDEDYRRQGLGTALLFQAIAEARKLELRAVKMETLANNMPAALLLRKCSFDLCGIDTHRQSNHDLVKDTVTLVWYAALD